MIILLFNYCSLAKHSMTLKHVHCSSLQFKRPVFKKNNKLAIIKLFIFNFFEMHPLMYKATLGHLEFYKSQAINKAR